MQVKSEILLAFIKFQIVHFLTLGETPFYEPLPELNDLERIKLSNKKGHFQLLMLKPIGESRTRLFITIKI